MRFFSKKKEHIDKIIEAAKYADKESDDRSDNFYDFLDYLGLDATFDGFIEDYDESSQAEFGGFSCHVNLEDIQDQFVSTSNHILNAIENIEKHFKKEVKVFFFSYYYDIEGNCFYCNDKEGLFYPWRYFVDSMVNSHIWYSPNCGEFYCDTKEFIDEVTDFFQIKSCEVMDAFSLKRAEKEDFFFCAAEKLENILKNKFPHTTTFFNITEVEMV